MGDEWNGGISHWDYIYLSLSLIVLFPKIASTGFRIFAVFRSWSMSPFPSTVALRWERGVSGTMESRIALKKIGSLPIDYYSIPLTGVMVFYCRLFSQLRQHDPINMSKKTAVFSPSCSGV